MHHLQISLDTLGTEFLNTVLRLPILMDNMHNIQSIMSSFCASVNCQFLIQLYDMQLSNKEVCLYRTDEELGH